MKNKILLSFTLFISCFLVFIFAVFAWFTLDDNSKSEDINTGIIDIDCDVNFEYLNDTSWIKIDKINHINLINPNDYIYFRLTLSTKKIWTRSCPYLYAFINSFRIDSSLTEMMLAYK